MELSKRTLRWIDNLESNTEFDLEKGIATVPLHYETPDDLLNEQRSRPGKPVISGETMDMLLDSVKEIPKEFSVNFSLTVDDYGDYDHAQLLDAIQKSIENTYYYYDEEKKHDSVLSVVFMIIGVLILCFKVIGGFYGVLGEASSISKGVADSLLVTFSDILVWEAGAVLFLTYENDSTMFHKELRRIHDICFVTETGEALSSVDIAAACKQWVNVGRKERIARNIILFTYPLIIALTIVEIGESAAQLEDLHGIYLFNYAFAWILVILLAISSISFYREKGPLKNWALPLSLVALAYMIVSLVGWYVGGEMQNIFFYRDYVGTILLLINIFCLFYMRRQNTDVHRKK